MKTAAWLVDDETEHARVVLGDKWPGGNYAQALVRMIDAQNDIASAIILERERCTRELADKIERLRAALETIAAQHSGEVCSAKKSDCMAAIAALALRA